MRFEDFFQKATGKAPYEYQCEFASAPLLPDILEAPTASGKTATASLGWLWRRLYGTAAQRSEAGARLVFCLPMRTLVEQTERAVTSWRVGLDLQPEQLGVHVLLGGAVDDAWEAYPDRDTILIGTQDQLLSRVLMRGYAMSRFLWPVHFALLNNDCTWVFDEVQLMGVGASTAAQLQAFREKLRVAGSVKSVWMTATLSEGRLRTVDFQRPLTRQPFVAKEPALKLRLRATKSLKKSAFVSGKVGSLGPLVADIVGAHQSGTLTLVIVNRVSRAQELSERLAREKGIERVALIHSRFRPIDRRRIQEAALNGAFAGVLVATQAIEAGVDLSAKTLFTELAPWSSLVQRFGRLNRAGEHHEAGAVWVDLNTDDEDSCLPYDAQDLVTARQRLQKLCEVSPVTLATVTTDEEEPALPVLRRKDLLEFFDTEPDLSGRDIDVSRYVRATDDRDVQVAWRTLGNGPPPPDAADLQRDELCSVPVYELKKLAKGERVWRFDSLRRKWVEVDVDLLHPGLCVVVDVSVGGYSAELGFTRDKADFPNALESSGLPSPDSDEADRLTYSSQYVTLELHASDTADEMSALLERLRSLTQPFVAQGLLIDAARWHDAGKVHPVFQQMLIAKLPESDVRRGGGPWAKSDFVHSGRNARRFFRHELASALTWLAAGRDDLGAFIIAAHHGKVRLSLRARPGEEPPPAARNARFAHGVHEGDELPAADLGAGIVVPAQSLSLGCMELGGGRDQGSSWSDRMARLLEEHGPFRLAYVEMLVRIADWRASKKRMSGNGGKHGE